jgi:hypothetical protein
VVFEILGKRCEIDERLLDRLIDGGRFHER